MNLSDSDNDTLIASCFDFIDVNDHYDSDSDDDGSDEDDIDPNQPYSYHSVNDIQQYFKSNGASNKVDGSDSDLEASDDDIYIQANNYANSNNGNNNNNNNNVIGSNHLKSHSSARFQRRRRGVAHDESDNDDESSDESGLDDSGDEPVILQKQQSYQQPQQNIHQIASIQQHQQLSAKSKKQFEPSILASPSVISTPPSQQSKKQSNNNSGNGKFKKSGSKNLSGAKDNSPSVVKILKRNETNMDQEQLSKLFNPQKGEINKALLEKSSTGNNNNGKPKRSRRERVDKKKGQSNGSATANGTGNGSPSIQQQQQQVELKRRYREEKAVGRTLGETPTAFDLDSVTFTSLNQFQLHEIVLVPRSRGGLTYGKIYEILPSTQCHHDTSVHHPGVNYRAIYPSGAKKDNLFKDLPSSYLGKLVAFDKVPPLSEQTAQQTPSATTSRLIGKKASLKDLQNLVFSPASKFLPNQIALIPRTKGGFTYGGIMKECKVPCKVGDIKHEVQGYRVLVEKRGEATIIKDLIVGNIGKIFSVENQQQVVVQQQQQQAAIAAQQQLAKNEQSATTTEIQPPVTKGTDVDNEDDDDDEEILWNGETPATAASNTTTTSTTSTIENNTQPNHQPPISKLQQPPVPGLRGIIEVPSDSVVFTKNKKNKSSSYLVVIDGPNVALKYGKKNSFSVVAIKKALDYYIQRGYDAVAFVPESVATRKLTGPNNPLKLVDFQPFIDNQPMFQELVDKGLICLTPPQDYDDSYAIQYAKKHNAIIVTNDRYNDHINKQETDAERQKARKFIREHCISFTFVRQEFLPNPDFQFPNT